MKWVLNLKSVLAAILRLAIFTVMHTLTLIAITLLILSVTLGAFLILMGSVSLSLCSEFSNILEFLKSKMSSLKSLGSSNQEESSSLTFQTLTGFWKSIGQETTLSPEKKFKEKNPRSGL